MEILPNAITEPQPSIGEIVHGTIVNTGSLQRLEIAFSIYRVESLPIRKSMRMELTLKPKSYRSVHAVSTSSSSMKYSIHLATLAVDEQPFGRGLTAHRANHSTRNRTFPGPTHSSLDSSNPS
jgi:hypothetical protein